MPPPFLRIRAGRPAAPPAPTRADVALFVGLVGRRPGAVPDAVRAELEANGFGASGLFKVEDGRLEALLDVPVAVASWSEFDQLFDWRSQPLAPGGAGAGAPGEGRMLPCPLGLAVRQFFRQGGVRAWIVRCGDPLPLADPALDAGAFRESRWNAASGATATAGRVAILPGLAGGHGNADPLDPATWHGAALAYALDDVAMLLLPDLPQLAAGPPVVPPLPATPPGPPEAFLPCAPPAATWEPDPRPARPQYLAPRLDAAGFRRWAAAIRHALDLLGRPKGPAHRRDVMLVGALPLPAAALAATAPATLDLLAAPGLGGPAAALFDDAGIGSARLQLAWPWLKTADAAVAPEGLQAGDGTLAGLLALTARSNGAFRSAAGAALAGDARPFPEPASGEVAKGHPPHADWLGERLALFATRRGETVLLSDSTMAASARWREGGVSRLMATLLRATRHLGEELLFEPNGPALWARAERGVAGVLGELRRLGAFHGATAEACYEVACNETTMRQADIDAGRLVCRVSFNPAYPVGEIIVTLLLMEPAAALEEAA